VSREADLYADDVCRWCDSCGAPLEDDDQILCDECDSDAPEDENELSIAELRAERCRQEAIDDAVRESHEQRKEDEPAMSRVPARGGSHVEGHQ